MSYYSDKDNLNPVEIAVIDGHKELQEYMRLK